MMRVRAREEGIGTDWEAPPPRSCWPDGAQREVLRACLLPPGEALSAYRRWLEGVDIQRLDHGSNRLLGLLFRNLSRAGAEFPHAALLKGNWRYHWVRNQLRMQELSGILRKMAEAGLPVMLLKGAALLSGYYEDYGSRPMADVDLLVPRTRAGEALDLFRALGYEPQSDLKTRPLEELMRWCPGMNLVKEGGVDIDLHWYANHECIHRDGDEGLWGRSVEAALEGAVCRAPGAGDLLLQVCAHGMRYNKIPPLRWLADARIILERGRVEARMLCAEAVRREQVLPLRKTLCYLEKHLGFLPGPGLRGEVRRMPAGWREWVEHPARVYHRSRLPEYFPRWRQYLHKRRMGRETDGFIAYYARLRGFSRPRAAVRLLRKTWGYLWNARWQYARGGGLRRP
jgi:hypothetical protein